MGVLYADPFKKPLPAQSKSSAVRRMSQAQAEALHGEEARALRNCGDFGLEGRLHRFLSQVDNWHCTAGRMHELRDLAPLSLSPH